jgi:ribulose bisphosphate carboxylase small subunit
MRRLRYLLGQLFELEGYSEAFDSFPAIAAHVTAYARMYLWSLMQTAGVGNYFYCDTDSLIVNEIGLDHLSSLIHDTELGKLKIQEQFEHLIIQGISKNAELISEGVYKQQNWPTFKGIFKTGDSNTYTVTSVTKHLLRDYTKGYVTKTGRIIPFSLQQNLSIC